MTSTPLALDAPRPGTPSPREGADNALLAEAVRCVARGWAVFPCHSVRDGRCTCGDAGKHPRYSRADLRHGVKDATLDPAQVRRWWTRWPQANLGVATGAVSGLVVLDVDGDHGLATVRDLEREHGPLPQTVTSRTGGGGRHYLFKHPGGRVPCRVALRPGLDVRADGGYIVAPPSVHASGRRYTWEVGCGPGEVELADAPAWLADLLQSPSRGEGTQPARAERQGHSTAYGREALRREARTLARAGPGTRNATLNRAAFKLGRLVGGGELDEEEARKALVVAATECGLVGDDGERRVLATLQSGLTTGMAKPRAAPQRASPEAEEAAVGPVVLVGRGVLRAGLSDGALALYVAREAFQEATGRRGRQVDLAAALNVRTTRTLKKWSGELRRAGLETYQRPSRRFLRVPAALILDCEVPAAAKATGVHLAALADRNGIARVGLAALGRRRRRGTWAIGHDLGALEKRGHLEVARAPYDPHERRRSRTNRYRLVARRPLVAQGSKAKKVHHSTRGAAKRCTTAHISQDIPPCRASTSTLPQVAPQLPLHREVGGSGSRRATAPAPSDLPPRRARASPRRARETAEARESPSPETGDEVLVDGQSVKRQAEEVTAP